MASRMVGVKEYRAALKRAPEHLKNNVVGAIAETTDGVWKRGKNNIKSMTVQRSGLLYREYRRSVSKKSLSGRVGYLSATTREVVYYARFVNDGTVHAESKPFHTNAVNAERELDTDRMVKARDRVLGALAGGGVGGASTRTVTLAEESLRR